MAGVVLCLYESGTRLATEITGDVEAYFERLRSQGPAWRHVRLFDTRIRRNIRLAEAPSFGQSIFRYDGASRGAEDYGALAGEVLAYYAGRELVTSAA
jgi:chromosome partitioning protein